MKQVNRHSQPSKKELTSQLQTLVLEVNKLSCKKPDERMNDFKIGFINQTIAKCNDVLGDKRPYESFTLFDSVSMPSNSDVLMILNMYLTAMRAL